MDQSAEPVVASETKVEDRLPVMASGIATKPQTVKRLLTLIQPSSSRNWQVWALHIDKSQESKGKFEESVSSSDVAVYLPMGVGECIADVVSVACGIRFTG